MTSTPGGWARYSRRDIEQYARKLDSTEKSTIQISTPAINRALGDIPKLARELTGADYAAVTVQEPDGRPLRMYHDGLPENIGWESHELPKGIGLLGRLGHADSPLRLDDLSTHPDSSGFPDWHPPMKALLGVQVANSDGLRANLY